ncbi:MAG: permease [Oscillospiraceae bacterium]|nr:permease [Oscillospiraceae bacterium]MDY3064447.1 permease [Oscillospiraceae bacterium]
MQILQTAEMHAGHDHGLLGEWVEALTERLPVSESVHEFITHFITDSLNIFLLLFVVMTAVYFLSSYINMDKLHRKLAHLNSIPGYLLAAAAGMLSPFCSCSILPVLIGLISVGVPVSVCLCYLTASSLINLTAIVSVFAVAGVQFGVAYLIGSVIILIALSVLLASLKLDSGVKHYDCEHHHDHEHAPKTVGARLKHALLDMLNMVKKCWLFILLGVALSSAIMAFFSLDAITQIVNSNEMLSSLIVSVVGIPIHSDIFTIAPVLLLLLKISPAVALSFALSSMVISIPSAILLTRALRGKTVALYCAAATGITMLVGLLSCLIL